MPAKTPIARRATSADPCEVCGTGTKGCSVTDDAMHQCRGEPTDPAAWTDVLRGREDKAGFRHFRRKGLPAPKPSRNGTRGKKAANKKAAAKDWERQNAQCVAQLDADGLAELSAAMRFAVDPALADKFGVGVWEFTAAGRKFSVPERGGDGRISTLTLRLPDGSKRSLGGGGRGVTWWDGCLDPRGPAFGFEGFSDCFAAAHFGLPGFAVSSAGANAAEAAALLRANGLADAQPLILVGDNDPRKQGEAGVKRLAVELAGLLNRPVGWTLPPTSHKDVRAYLTAAGRGGSPRERLGDELRELLVAGARWIDPSPANTAADGSGSGKGNAAAVLVELAEACELWRGPTGEGYASVGRRSMGVRDKAFRLWLTRRYRQETGGVPNGEAVSAALNAVEAACLFDGPTHEPHVRAAYHAGTCYLHLHDDADTVIEADAAGWRVCEHPPVRFRRCPAALPLPTPARGGSLEPLRRLFHLDGDQFALLAATLTAYLCPVGPVPVQTLSGVAGASKTTLAKAVKALIDPSALPTRSEPKEVRDLMVMTRGSWVLAFDNLSHLPAWLSDAICTLATGGGFSTRELHTNTDEVVFTAKRPVILTGIEDVSSRGDLLSRSVLVRLPAVPDHRRVTEGKFWAGFDALRPALLGALLSRVSAGLRELPGVTLPGSPRMADFCTWAVACERGAGEEPRFLSAFRQNEATAAEVALDASPLAAVVVELMAAHDEYADSPAELLKELSRRAPTPRPRAWPQSPNALTGRLRRLAPDLARVHRIGVEAGRSAGGNRTRVVRLSRLSAVADPAGEFAAKLAAAGKTMAEVVGWVNAKFDENYLPDAGSDDLLTDHRNAAVNEFLAG